MKFKSKIMLLCIAPILLALFIVVIAVRMQTDEFVQNQVSALEESIMEEKRRELANYVDLAMNSIKSFLELTPPNQMDIESTKQSLTRLLVNLTFEKDGYFFVYDMEGNNIVHPLQPWRVGKNWLDLQDVNGKYVIKDLIERAKEGGGFELYVWERPTTEQNGDKYAYVVPIPQLNWMLGTGIYIDSVRGQVNALRADIKQRVQRLYWITSVILGFWIVGIGTYLSFLVYRETNLADARLHALNDEIINVQEEERRRVSRELHDGISQILVTAKYAFALSQSRVDQGKVTHGDSFAEGFGLIDEAVNEVRRISQDLRPKVLDDLGLAAALKMLANRFETTTGIKTSVHVIPVNDALSDEKKSALFRIAQEALTNIKRHSEASHVDIEMVREAGHVRLEITDNGIGLVKINQKKSQNFGYGLGIANMEERLNKFDGQLEISTIQNGSQRGTCLLVKMPVEGNIMISSRNELGAQDALSN